MDEKAFSGCKEKPDKETCDKFGGKITNCVCMVDGYPMATGEQISVPILHKWLKEEKNMIINPQGFLNLSPKILYDEKAAEEIRKRIEGKQPIDPLWLELKRGHFQGAFGEEVLTIVDHEGRHRALVTKEMGLDRLPVVLRIFE